MISPFDPSRETAYEYEYRVREEIARKLRSRPQRPQRSDSPDTNERRLRSMLMEFCPPEVRDQLRVLNKNGFLLLQPKAVLLEAINSAGKKYLVSSKRSLGTKSTASSARSRLRYLQQRDGASVADFLKELEDTVVQCGYPDNVADSVASQRLVAGLRSFEARATLVDLMERPVGASYNELRKAALQLPLGGPGGGGSEAPHRREPTSTFTTQQTSASSALATQQWTGDNSQMDFFQAPGGKSGGAALQMFNGKQEKQREQQQQQEYRNQASDRDEPSNMSSRPVDREQGIYVQLWPASGDGSNCARQVRAVPAVPRGGTSTYVWNRRDFGCGTGGQSDGLKGVQRGVGVTYSHQSIPLALAECQHCGVVSKSSLGTCPQCFRMFRDQS